MPRPSETTRERIVQAANSLFYSEGIRRVSVDEVAAKAGLTKRTLYYHFKSKDDLVAAYLAARDQPNLALFRKWFSETEGGVPVKVEAIFKNLARSARHSKWKGCGFLRTSAELANMPGHPGPGSGTILAGRDGSLKQTQRSPIARAAPARSTRFRNSAR